MKVKVKVSQLCPTFCDPMDYTVHGILQARILDWVAFPFSRGSPQPRDQTQVSRIAGGFFTSWATGKSCQSARYFLPGVCISWVNWGFEQALHVDCRLYLCGLLTFQAPWQPWTPSSESVSLQDCGRLLDFQPGFVWTGERLKVKICTNHYPVLSSFNNLLQYLPVLIAF